ncbi:hypothetical protein L218DRAFT_944136 [Marasmius fiardii PR-910]|nr:hypothetical protein L218DRAFT_944136 [Marasmius fiardii PR-910]
MSSPSTTCSSDPHSSSSGPFAPSSSYSSHPEFPLSFTLNSDVDEIYYWEWPSSDAPTSDLPMNGDFDISPILPIETGVSKGRRHLDSHNTEMESYIRAYNCDSSQSGQGMSEDFFWFSTELDPSRKTLMEVIVDGATLSNSLPAPSDVRGTEPQPLSLSTLSPTSTSPPIPQAITKPKFRASGSLLERLDELENVCKASHARFSLPSSFTDSIGKRRQMYSEFAYHAQELRKLDNSSWVLLAGAKHAVKWSSISKDIQTLHNLERQFTKARSSRSLAQWEEYDGKDAQEVAWLPSSLEELQMQVSLVNNELKKKKMDATVAQSGER